MDTQTQATTQSKGAPAVQLKTNRSVGKLILLGIVTLCIYPLVLMCGISTDINIIASPYDGKKTMHFALVIFVLSGITLGIFPIIWMHKLFNRIGAESARRGINNGFSAKSFWIMGFLLSFTIVCPILFWHKFLTAMNEISADYNVNG